MEKQKYCHAPIETKWQKYWEENKTFSVKIDHSKPKYYVLDMFPYPSGAGLHVGHPAGYTATDIIARYKRQKGFNVLHPMGWDSFGLPAEQYAISTGIHPSVITKSNTDNFRRQLKALGFCYDWDREIATSDVTYYKWTQWIFTKLYERGLAYEAEVPVNYCPALKTVLANEEIDNGKSKEGGHPIERRPLKQWMLKITAYADRLLDDLKDLDWPDNLKRQQINWIGKSEGAKIDFVEKQTGEVLTVFTTCPNTLFGVTYMVLAPEHPVVDKITTPQQKQAVAAYRLATGSKSDLDRTDLSKEKTGVSTGAFAVNPVNGKHIPVWVADYVLLAYGTGIVMAVPAHDERDFEFAAQYKLSVLAVIDPAAGEEIRQEVLAGKHCWTGEGKAINSHQADISLEGLSVAEAKVKIVTWLEKVKKGEAAVNYKLRDWLFSRQRYWGEPMPLLHFQDEQGGKRVLDAKELPLELPKVTAYKPTETGESPLAALREWVEITDPKTGRKARRETHTMPQWAGSCWYYLRFCDPLNTKEAWSPEAEQHWAPVDLYVGGAEHAVLHLLYARFWHKVLFDCGLVHTNEPFKKLVNPGMVISRSYQTKNRSWVSPEDVVEKEGEYFHRTTGESLFSQMEKMSKSRLNVVSPDEIVQEFGADSLRLYEMFMGPIEKEKVWNTDSVSGCRRFLSRFYDMVTSDKASDEESEEALKLAHRLIEGVTKDIEAMLFNTAIAKMMEFLNEFLRLPAYPRPVLKMATLVLAPFAPHLAEEMWQFLGNGTVKGTVIDVPYPEADPKYLQNDMATYVVQVNGKLRGKFELPNNQDEQTILALAREHPNISKHLEGKITKVVFVPNKLLSIVITQHID